MTKDNQNRRLSRALALTGAGLWWESVARAFWPFATLALLAIAALSFGAVGTFPVTVRPYVVLGVGLVLLAALVWGGWRFRRPDRHAAERRVDAVLPGRPLSALSDAPVLGGDGPLWQAHQRQMAERAAQARAVAPDAGLSRRDPYGLRLVALTALGMALLFGSTGQLGQGLAALAPQREAGPDPVVVPDGLGWEGWAEPPPYTRKPTIYLNDLPEDDVLHLPEGSTISLRLYGEDGEIAQDIGEALPGDDARSPQFRVERNGSLTIGDRRINVTVQPDAPPSIGLGPPAERRADGRLIQPFTASDDFGVTEGRAVITLDLDKINRDHGLTIEPETRDPVEINLPLRGARAEVEGQLTSDLMKHAWANMPVQIRLNVKDGIGQEGQSDVLAMELPGRRFFDPFAAALIELRRDILWNRMNAEASAQLLRAISWQPEGFIDPPMLNDIRAMISGLETPELTDAQRDALAEALWRTAVELEDGGLADALERMRRAQEKLSSAMRRGASPDEISKLMEELRQATDDYMERLAEQGENDPSDRFNQGPVDMVSGDQIQQMMDEIQRLMNEGRMAEAQALLEQFNRMMENMQVRRTEGEGGGQGQGQGSSGRMAETLREQQDLADEAFRQMQDEWMGLGEPQGQQQGQGEQQGEGEGAGQGGQSLADQQRQLRDDLGMQRSLLPERGSPEGQEAGDAMDRAGRAMEQAEQALRDGNSADAMDRQAEAIEALRDGIRALDRGDQRSQDGQQAESMDGEEGQEGAAGQQGETQRGLGRNPRRDPLGRSMGGSGGGLSTDGPLAEGEDADNRARDLQDEIRRRLGERDRTQDERDYLDRLIEQF
ncbi:MAG: DUF4175 domain-containing protein [Paracoccus denitrificans]|uniref:DUF4175 domain-containing protein n=1 Tax=Paracoccus denitrificans TaxID=266 RepID=A0A533IB46_PARDE|nr:MAG: DUF4175 domain-containing protein [Paracoccus denitrificans]